MGMHIGSELSPFLSAAVVDVFTEFAREGVFGELLYVDDLVLIVRQLRDSGIRSQNGWRHFGARD